MKKLFILYYEVDIGKYKYVDNNIDKIMNDSLIRTLGKKITCFVLLFVVGLGFIVFVIYISFYHNF